MTLPNFLITEQKAEDLLNSLKLKCLNTGTTKLPSFGNESSFLTTKLCTVAKATRILAIDVGGTRTKVCVRTGSSGDFSWLEVLERDNNHLKSEGVGRGLERMTLKLSGLIADSCRSLNIALEFDGVAVVWSNKLQCMPLTGATKGVGAKVFGSEDGQAYRKGEWWNSDIRDGDDIGATFLKGLQSANIHCPILVIGNDTIFTAKALALAQAGVVSSTGANTTIVALNGNTLLNSECGGAIELSADLLCLKNHKALIPETTIPIKIEDLSAGKGLPLMFELLVSEALSQGATELKTVDDFLNKQPITAKDISGIVRGEGTEIFELNTHDPLTANTLESIRKIAEQLISNAGTMCAVLILISVVNQLESEESPLVALDSSQARFVPGYIEACSNFLDIWNARNKKNVRFELLQPDGKISVPLRGAANSIEEFL